MSRALAALALVLTVSACGPEEHALEGSLSEVVNLRFRDADLTLGESELALRFIAPQGAGENVVLRVTASTLGTSVDAQETLDLAELDPVGAQRGRITRAVHEDPLTELPPLQRGGLVFDRSPLAGERVTGSLHVTFAQGTELASGRTVFGSFEARVQ